MNSAEIRKQIRKWEESKAGASKSQSDYQAKVVALEAERKSLVVAARTKGDAAAKERIDAIAADLARAHRELRDDGDALTECNAMISKLRGDLALAEREEDRQHIHELIAARASGDLERSFCEALDQLSAAVKKISKSDRDLASQLRSFDGDKFNGIANRIAFTSGRALFGQMLFALADDVPMGSIKPQRKMVEEGLENRARFFEGILAQLEPKGDLVTG